MENEKKKKHLSGLRLFVHVMKETHMLPVITGFIVYFFIMSTIIYFTCNSHVSDHSNINNYGDALWFSFASVFTIGYGDVTVSGVLGRILTVLLVIYGVFVIALIPSVFLTYYQEKMQAKMGLNSNEFLDKFEHLEDLSKEELKNLSTKLMALRKKRDSKK